MTDLSITGTGWINGEGGWPCQLRTETDRIDVSTNLPKADANWSFVDSNGHFHAYNQRADDGRNRYPTLYERTEVRTCDNADHDHECDGAHITHWHCAVCDEEVKPGKIPGPHYEYMDGLTSWQARIQVPAEHALEMVNARDRVIVRVANDTSEVFGVGVVLGDFTMTSGDQYVAVTIVCGGPLGARKVTS